LLELGYHAVGLGTRDLQLNTDAVAYVAANLDPEANPLTSANAGVYGFDSGLSHPYRIAEVGGKRIGMVSILGAKEQAKLTNTADVVLKDPTHALAETAPKLSAENCDLQILLMHGSPDEARQLVLQFPQFDYVVATGGAEQPPSRLQSIEGSEAKLVEAGHKGMYVVVLGLFDDAETPLRYQRVPLDARFEDSPAMQKMLIDYQRELETLGLEGLGLHGSAHPDAGFVGSEACADCHTNAWAVFEKTPHAHALDTLVQLKPPRHFDPECLSCHVTGWNPQQYFPYASGYFDLQKTPALLHNGCENCHGPGGAHVAAEWGDEDVSDDEIEARRAAMRMKIVENEGNKEGQVFTAGSVVDNCMQCHDLDNSPDFDFQKYWPSVAHEGKD
ncbi:MAG: multiheme c-type cytochrome, partial [Planctomycetota bacterium]